MGGGTKIGDKKGEGSAGGGGREVSSGKHAAITSPPGEPPKKGGKTEGGAGKEGSGGGGEKGSPGGGSGGAAVAGKHAASSVREAFGKGGGKHRLTVVVWGIGVTASGALSCVVMDFNQGGGGNESFQLYGTAASYRTWVDAGIEDGSVVELKGVEVYMNKQKQEVMVNFAREVAVGNLAIFTGTVERWGAYAGPVLWHSLRAFGRGKGEFVSCMVGKLVEIEENGRHLTMVLGGSGAEVRVTVGQKRKDFKDGVLVPLEGKVVEVWGLINEGGMCARTDGWKYLVRELPKTELTAEKYAEMEGAGEEEEDEVTKALLEKMGGK